MVQTNLKEKKKKKHPGRLKDLLSFKLTQKERAAFVSSFDSVGNIVVIEIPRELEKKEKLIAKTLLAMHPRFETVAKKTGAHAGRFRAEPLKIIAGKKNLTATYRESGCVFRIRLGKVFFSPRLGTERLRIARKIKKNEVVGAFFAGVGPFPIVFARHSAMKKAVAIELNPVAVQDLKHNIVANKVTHKVVPVLGDVAKIVPQQFAGQFDRIVMPMPKGSADFLEAALFGANPSGCVIHFYAFVPARKPFGVLKAFLRQKIRSLGFSVRFLHAQKVRSFSKDTLQAVVDCKVKRKVKRSNSKLLK